jgi:hypothetical protein
MNRISTLEAFLKEDPNDPFNIYALALEYLKTDRDTARALFQTLFDQHAEYLPTYYPFAHLMADLGQKEQAEQLFIKGIEQAHAAKDEKTLRELRSAYNDFKFEMED